MLLSRFVFILVFGATVFAASYSRAEDAASQKPATESAVPADDKATAKDDAPINPKLAKLDERTQKLVKSLDGQQLKHLYHIRETFGATRAVKIVRRDVGNAVKACGKDNPDMKAEMDDRFAKWTESVDPAIKGKEKEIDDSITAQNYLKPKEIKDYLKMIEKAAEDANKGIEKVTITTPDSCKGLIKSMDRTQDVVAKLIESMVLTPWPPVVDEDDTREDKPSTTPN